MSENQAAAVATASSTPLLALKGFTKSFGAVEALKDVDLELHAGEVVGLVGDNGAGKSTLIKSIAGAQPPDRGEATFEGRPVQLSTPQAATALGIATVYQDLALAENLDVVANLFLGQEIPRRFSWPERLARWRPRWPSGLERWRPRWPSRLERLRPRTVRILDETAMEQKAVELLGSLGVTTLRSVRTEVASLSGGQRQAVAIARSLLGDPKVVLLDEPTAALGIVQTAQILKLIERLRERGLAVVVISHNLANVFDVSDKIAVLRLGRMAATFDVNSTTRDEVVSAITGAGLEERATEETPL